MPVPNFFIVGAPKCGTTALSEYLREHPNVFMCKPKEPHYFATDLPGYRFVTSEKEYIGLFDEALKIHKIIGEASVYYMYSKLAISEIYKFNPNARIIVMLRNPIQVVHSLHMQLLYNMDENEVDFEKAWDLIPLRKNGKNAPKNVRDIKILYYDEIAKMGEQLERLLNIFPKEHVKIIFFEEFVNNTRAVYKEVLKFLDLPDDNRKKFPKINQNKRNRLKWLANFTQRPPILLVNFSNKIKVMFNLKYIGFKYILTALRKVNMVTEPRKPMSIDLKIKILKEYKDDILELELLTGKNLTSWLQLDET